MSTLWPWILISVVIIVLIGFPAWGLYTWTPRRARMLKHLEIVDERQTIIAHIAYIRMRHPELVKLERLDRHPAYVWSNVSLFAFGLVTLIITAPYSTLGGESLGTRAILSGSLLLGSGATLTGSLLGKRVGRWWIRRSVADNDTAAMLGDDIRVPYVLAWAGMASIAISMAFYGYTVVMTAGVPRLLTTLGGITAVSYANACLTLIPSFIRRIRAYITARDTVLNEAYAIMDEEDR